MPTRRTFLATLAGLSTAMSGASSRPASRAKPRLAFSTLGCPDWSLAQILDCAQANDYQGIELRGLQRQLDLPQCPEFNSPAAIASTRKLFKSKGLQVVNLGSSARLHLPEGPDRQRNLADAKRFIDLAQALGCPYVRVFPDDLPEGQDREATLGRIAAGLVELGQYAKKTSVTVLLESHGKVVSIGLLHDLMRRVAHQRVGLIWDVVNMWAATGEPPARVYAQLRLYIRHVHLKDAKLAGGHPQYVLLGEGEAPLTEAIGALRRGNYRGVYSFEWEKMWHPEIAGPEVALPHFAGAIAKYFL
jgi:sugar phosphate isomerase/epimerase